MDALSMKFSIALMSASALALGACGSSGNSAPVVYGTQPASTGASKIYNSPNDYDAQNAAYNRAGRPSTMGARVAASTPPKINNAYARPAPLVPVTQTTYDRSAQIDLPPRPIYIANTQPVGEPARATVSSSAIVTVQPGDTVYAIGRRTGASPQAIIALNRLRAPYALEIGDRLRIPGARLARQGGRVPAAPTQIAQPARQVVSQDVMHTVRPGETLYGVSRATGASVQVIAQANQLRTPYKLVVGQRLLIPGATNLSAATTVSNAVASDDVGRLAREVSYTQPSIPAAPEPDQLFEWPVKGAIIGKYGPGEFGKRNDGVNIAAPTGTPVRAAAAGEVVYRGSELDGYGNLLLIRHDDGYVTAYAHNDAMLVRKGQKVNQGQVIAKVGQTGSATEPQLHFEIRQNLKSIDPLAFLGS